MSEIPPRYLKTKEAAAFMGVSIGTIRAWKNAGRLTAYYFTAHPSFLVTDLIDIGDNAPNFAPTET